MSSVLARVSATPFEFSPEQQKMIRASFLNGASQSEASVLMELARLRRLNPITKQIHFVKRWDSQRQAEVWSAQVGIDGFRAIAERTGKYDGQDEPTYEYDDKRRLIECRVKVYRKDWSRPAVGVAHFSEYAQFKKDGSLVQMWASKPHVMLAKCAEALAFRKAFPEDTSGLYAPEEMPDEREVHSSSLPLVTVNATPPENSVPQTAPNGGAAVRVRAALAARKGIVVDMKAGETEEQAEARVKAEVTPATAGQKPTPWQQALDIGRQNGLDDKQIRVEMAKISGKSKPAELTETDVEKLRQKLEPPLPGDEDAPFNAPG